MFHLFRYKDHVFSSETEEEALQYLGVLIPFLAGRGPNQDCFTLGEQKGQRFNVISEGMRLWSRALPYVDGKYLAERRKIAQQGRYYEMLKEIQAEKAGALRV